MSTQAIVVSADQLFAIQYRPLPPDRHPAHVYIARLGSGSRRTMSEALNTIAAIITTGRADMEKMPWAALRYQHTAAVRAALMEKYKPSTANKMLAALRGVLKESWRLGYMTAEDYHRAADVPTIKAQTLPRGRALASGEIAALMNTCGRDSSPAGIRDAALIAVLYGAGLRPSKSVGHVWKRRAVQSGVASFSPHDLRRSFISDLLDAGADISTAQQLAGHANVQTTARYDRRGEATKRKAAELLHVPYLRREANR